VFVMLNASLNFIEICICPRRQRKIVILSRIKVTQPVTHAIHSLNLKLLNPVRKNRSPFYLKPNSYRPVNTLPHGYKNYLLDLVKAKSVVGHI
jgi:hypothetical protein